MAKRIKLRGFPRNRTSASSRAFAGAAIVAGLEMLVGSVLREQSEV